MYLNSPEGEMLTKDGMKDVIRSAYLARVHGDVDGVVSAFSDQAIFEINAKEALGESTQGREAIRNALAGLVQTLRYEDWKETALIVDDNQAAIRWQAKITNIEANRSHVFDCLDFIEFSGDRISRLYHTIDTAAFAALLAPNSALSTT
jgi:ketosteroid isomerase-like protein